MSSDNTVAATAVMETESLADSDIFIKLGIDKV